MRKAKVALIVLLLFLAGIQFIPTKRNDDTSVPPIDFIRMYDPPIRIQTVLRSACYDCHSNSTRYPWYTTIQPVGMFMASHIRNGKAELNLSTFGTYSIRRQHSKIESMINQLKDDEMPLMSYRLMHSEARLNQSVKEELMNYLDSLATQVK